MTEPESPNNNENKAEDLIQNSAEEDSGIRQQQHVSNYLGDALEDAKVNVAKPVRSMILLDVILALGLLLAVGAFVLGLFKMYIMHSAEQSITQQNYKAAIAILRDNPVPALFNGSGSDGRELLNQALYLDAMDKLEGESDVDGALKELEQIEAGSRYFSLAQEIITEYYVPSTTLLQSGTEKTGEASPEAQRRPIEEELNDSN